MTRQLTVIGVYGAYAALALFVFGLGGKQMMLPAFPAALFGVAAWIGAAIFWSNKSYWRLANAPVSALDEREVQARLAAYWLSYVTLVTVVFVSLVALTLGSDIMRIKTWDVNDVSALVWGVFLLGITLPTAVMMWTHNIKAMEDDA